MPIEFYAPHVQHVAGPVTMLPQKGSVSGGSKRPLNSYAILANGTDGRRTVLLDAPFSWVMDALQANHEAAPIVAHVLSHRDLAGSGDAFAAQARAFGAPFLLHRADQAEEAPSKLDLPLEDVSDHPVLAAAGIEVIHMPGHSPGSILLHLPSARVLLTGDSAVGPGPEQDETPPRLQRPKMEDDAEAVFCDAMERLFDRLPALDAVLPLHGHWYTRAELGGDAFDHAIRSIWEGEPMDPAKT